MKIVRAGCNHRTPPPGPWISWITRCSSCTRTVHRTIPGTVRRHARACARCPRCPRRRAAGRPASSSPPSMTPGCSPAISEPRSPRPSPPRSAADGPLPRWPHSPAPTPRVCAIRSRCSPLGAHPPNCPRRPGSAWPGRHGAGECDQVTRMLGFDGDAPRPCPRCKPAVAASRASPATPLPAPVPIHLRRQL